MCERVDATGTKLEPEGFRNQDRKKDQLNKVPMISDTIPPIYVFRACLMDSPSMVDED